MKTFLIIPVLFFVSMTSIFGFDEGQRAILIEKCFKPTVLVESATSTAAGTGFITKSVKIDDINCYCNIVFSCEHILKSTDLVIKQSNFDSDGLFTKYQNHQGVVAAMDGENDLSLLFFLSKEKMPCVDLTTQYKPKIMDNLLAVGHGLGEVSRFSEGKLTGVLRSETTKQILSYKTSVSIIFGDSGGPLFYENKVIGIANSMRNVDIGENKHPVYNISFYKPLSLMDGILQNYNVKGNNMDSFKIPEIMLTMLWAKSIEIED